MLGCLDYEDFLDLGGASYGRRSWLGVLFVGISRTAGILEPREKLVHKLQFFTISVLSFRPSLQLRITVLTTNGSSQKTHAKRHVQGPVGKSSVEPWISDCGSKRIPISRTVQQRIIPDRPVQFSKQYSGTLQDGQKKELKKVRYQAPLYPSLPRNGHLWQRPGLDLGCPQRKSAN